MNEHKYRLQYYFPKPEGGSFTPKDVKPDHGLTDCLLVASVLYPEDGSYSQMHWTWTTYDGRNELQPWNPNDLFKFWIMLARRVADDTGLSAARRLLAEQAFQIFVSALRPDVPGRLETDGESTIALDDESMIDLIGLLRAYEVSAVGPHNEQGRTRAREIRKVIEKQFAPTYNAKSRVRQFVPRKDS